MRTPIRRTTQGLTALLLGLAVVSFDASAQQAPPAPLMPLQIEGDVERGKPLATTCAGCHAIDGYRNAYPSFHVPKIGGQHADFIEIALQGYRRGTRGHDTMHSQAVSLSDQDIADIAAYIASLEGEASPGLSRASSDMVAAGEQIATERACASCHGPSGISETTQWPIIAGQHSSYLEHSLRQYKSGARTDIQMAPMAAPLTDEDIRLLAAYFAAQETLFTPDTM